MSYCTANGVPVVRGELVLPRIGVWHADLELEDDTEQSGPVALSWWDGQLALKGMVRYGGAQEGASKLHVLGGSGGLTTPVPPKAFRNIARRSVVQHLLGLAGEHMSPRADPVWLSSVLPFYTLMESTVGRSLTLMVELQAGISWRVLADGDFWFGAEAWGEVDVDYEELSRDPHDYRMDIATDTPALMPGCTFLGQRISTVTYRINEDDLRVSLAFEATNA